MINSTINFKKKLYNAGIFSSTALLLNDRNVKSFCFAKYYEILGHQDFFGYMLRRPG